MTAKIFCYYSATVESREIKAKPLKAKQLSLRAVSKKKIKSARKDAKTQRTRKAFLCDTFAALRLCVKVFAFFCNDCTLNRQKVLIVLPSKQA